MSRIARAFTNRFNQLLGEFGARQREKGVGLLFGKARRTAELQGISQSHALAWENATLARKLRKFKGSGINQVPAEEIRVICDAGLGGLARWLRASGVEAHWIQDIDDGELLRKALELQAVVITTDSFLLDRRLITAGEVRALWVPPTLKIQEQLELVLAELGIEPEPSRCMKCGGALREVEKEEVKDRIPPKTYRWIDQYFECTRCNQLFWHGTHWARIQQKLASRRLAI